MDLIDIYKNLVKETVMFRSFKRIGLALRILCIIAVIPFMLAYAATLLVYGGVLVVHKMLNVPADYILSFIKSEGKDVKHLTQAVIYSIGFPVVFLLKFFSGFLVFILFCLHLYASLVGFVATLAGITFKPFLMDPVDRFIPRENKPYNKIAVICFAAIGCSLLLACLIYIPIANANAYTIIPETYYNSWTGSYYTYNYYYLNTPVIAVGMALVAIYELFVIIYSAVAFRSKKIEVSEAEAPIAAEKPAEAEQSAEESTPVLAEE